MSRLRLRRTSLNVGRTPQSARDAAIPLLPAKPVTIFAIAIMRSSVLLVLLPLCLAAQSVRPAQLRCEYRVNPAGIDTAQPRLSWVLSAADPKARGLHQSAYRVLVASSEAGLAANRGDLWDSGRVASDQSIHVAYAGKPLAPGARAFWKVATWSGASAPAWSEAASWSMGIGTWAGKWIGRDETSLYKDPGSIYQSLAKARWIWAASDDAGKRTFSAKFSVPTGRRIAKAIVMGAAEGNCDVSLNGAKVGHGGSVRIPDPLDATSQVRTGENTIAITASKRPNAKAAGLLAMVKVEFTSGEPLLVTSGADWQVDGAAVRDLGAYGMEPWGDIGFIEERALPARMLRKEFAADQKVKHATASVSGLGLYEMYLNGAKVGDQVLSPGLTDYTKRALYVTFDVTKQVAQGRNAIGLVLGNGRYWAPREKVPTRMLSYGYPKAILQLDLEFEDGSRSSVVTDETWKLTTAGPIRSNNEYDGERYDARQEMAGWSRAGFNDAKWEAARPVEPPAGALTAQMAEPLRVTETLKPKSVKELRPGVFIFDMGQNMVGWCRLHVAGPKGTQVRLRHAETLRPDGGLYVDNLRSARATDLYVLKGQGAEVWEPRFTYHGFRYVEVSGYPGKPTLAAIDGRVVHDDMPSIADFVTSNDLLNRIHKNIYWGIRGNYRSIPTDCPQRDERQGWLGDRSQVSRSESYMFDVAAFYSKWETDLADSQRATGSIPDVSPTFWPMYNDNLTWPSTFLYVPGMLYDQYGDLRVIERNYAAMKKWIDYVGAFAKDDLMPRDTYGDWCVPPESPELIHSKDPARKTAPLLIGTSYYYGLLNVMAHYAQLLHKDEDASAFVSRAGAVKVAFQKKFYDDGKGFYDNGTQTATILPLAFGITPEADRARVFQNLISRIENESKGHVGTGLVGAQWLMRTLSENGRADVALQIASQKTYPGLGYMVEQGATTIWELWNGNTADPGMNSGNHVMQVGDMAVWMYEYLAGIRTDPTQPGFKHTIVRPYTVAGLDFVKASHQTMYGKVAASWKRAAGSVQLDVTVPPNTTATVYVPAKDAAAVTEGGRPAAQAKGVKFVRNDAGAAVYEVESGSYSFAAKP